MRRLLVATMAWAFLGTNSGFAQSGTGGGAAQLGISSPLGLGPASPVAPTGIPLGAFELSSPGVAPTNAPATSIGPTAGQSACSNFGGSIPEATFGPASPAGSQSPGMGSSMAGPAPPSSTVFDGGGNAGTASGTCGATATATANPSSSASSPTGSVGSVVGRVGIPPGSTELGVGGLSPPPVTLTGPSSIQTGGSLVP